MSVIELKAEPKRLLQGGAWSRLTLLKELPLR